MPRKVDRSIERFDGVERAFHWTNAGAFFVLTATGAAVFFPALSAAVGHRDAVVTVHEWAGFTVAGLVPFLAGAWGHGLRRDLGLIEAFDADDMRWLRGGWREDLFGDPGKAPPQGKFNAGQKLNAAASAGTMVVLLGTGAIMFWHRHFPLWLKQGANLVHDLAAVALVLLVVGHIALALRDRQSMRGMLTGRVDRAWGREHHLRWVEPVDPDSSS